MALTVAPKPAATRQRRNRSTTAATLEAAPARKVPLPERTPPWHALTLATWDVWWNSPMQAEWVDADVPGLIELAQLVDDFWHATNATDRARLRAEIRLSSREYGLSSLSRRQLQWEVRRVKERVPTQPAAGTRRRSGKAVLSVLRSA